MSIFKETLGRINKALEDHAANLAIRIEKERAVRPQKHKDLMDRAIADAKQRTLETDAYCKQVAEAVIADKKAELEHQLLSKKLKALTSEDASILAKVDNLTDTDIVEYAEKIWLIRNPN